jgi:hypothetical protein
MKIYNEISTSFTKKNAKCMTKLDTFRIYYIFILRDTCTVMPYFKHIVLSSYCTVKKYCYIYQFYNICWICARYAHLRRRPRKFINCVWCIVHKGNNKITELRTISDWTHHFFRNACTKSGSLRFSQFSGCWLILSVYIIMSFYFPFVRLFGVR